MKAEHFITHIPYVCNCTALLYCISISCLGRIRVNHYAEETSLRTESRMCAMPPHWQAHPKRTHCVEHREGCGYDRHRDNARAEPGDAMHNARGQERR